MAEVIVEPNPTNFVAYWAANEITAGSPVIEEALFTVDSLIGNQEYSPQTLQVTDVTLRDGQQQRTESVTIANRVEVFDSIVATGVDRIEIGHLGNSNGDQQLADEIVRHIAEKERSGEDDFSRIKIQVLFGSQQKQIQEGIQVLETAFQASYGEEWREVMSQKVVVHVYDRLSDKLRNLATEPYSAMESAERISIAAQYAIDAGFKHFSVSGEGATAESVESAIQFHRSIDDYLFDHGAESVNVNLANTFGFSVNQTWNAESLALFNAAVKSGHGSEVSTSIHTHNDFNSAVDYSLTAVLAGFDRVEGAHTGMGERAGNVSSIDVVARLLEQAMHEENKGDPGELASHLGQLSFRGIVQLDPQIAAHLSQWHNSGEVVSRVFGRHAGYRFRRTIIGNPYALDNGSGPHDNAAKRHIEDPVKYAIWQNYESVLPVDHIMGRPETLAIASGDIDAIRAVTVDNHAGGGSTVKIMEGGDNLPQATEERRAEARANFLDYTQKIVDRVVKGTLVIKD